MVCPEFMLLNWKNKILENPFSVWWITGNLFCVCAFLVRKLKVGKGMCGKRPTMETLILSGAAGPLGVVKCFLFYVLKTLIFLLQNLARKAAF